MMHYIGINTTFIQLLISLNLVNLLSLKIGTRMTQWKRLFLPSLLFTNLLTNGSETLSHLAGSNFEFFVLLTKY